MSSYFDDASLVMIPSGYKTSKVYSVKPTDGSGDLTFSRSNDTATRVNSAGLIEKVRTNQVLQSQTFDNASWVKYNSSVTANSTTAPDGTSTADTLVDNTANDIHVTYQSIALSAGEHTISCYAKANTLSHLSIYIFDGTNFFSSGIFNLSNGTVSGAGSIVSAGNGWYRVSFTATIGSGSGNVYIALSNGSTISYVGSGQSIYIWGYQVEAGVATAYIATTTAAVSVGPVANVPRLDYLNSSCPRLLLEPQRTNLALFSEQADDAYWNKYQSSIIANDTVSPDGTQNADRVTITALDTGVIYKGIGGISSGTQTSSFFAKAGTATTAFLQIYDGTTGFSSKYNLSNGTTSNTTAGATATITPYGNGWYRCTLTATTAGGTHFLDYGLSSQTVGHYGHIWGFQYESLASYATSYIPTLGAAVTRGADAASKTGISSLIGQTEGTLFCEVSTQQAGSTASWFNISDGSSVNWVFIGKDVNKMRGFIRFNGTTIFSNESFTITDNASMKVAIAYKSGDYAMYINGSLIASGTSSFSVSAPISRMDLGVLTSPVDEVAKYNQALLFKTRLTNAQLAELTTL